jgi:hypothetical protein
MVNLPSSLETAVSCLPSTLIDTPVIGIPSTVMVPVICDCWMARQGAEPRRLLVVGLLFALDGGDARMVLIVNKSSQTL